MFPRRGKQVVAAATLYVEDVFSAFTDIGTGSSLAQVNGVDLATYGGMVLGRGRAGTSDYWMYDTARGVQKDLVPNSTAAETSQAQGITAFNSNGFTRGTLAKLNTSTATYVSWTFRKAARFFDVVTYTGNGANRTIAHNLGIAPGMIMIKRTDNTSPWTVYHRSLANTEYAVLNTTAAKVTGATTYWNSATATATEFSLGTSTDVNTNTATYVAYVFAHDTATDGIIQCGTFTTDGSGNATVTLGWEPQFVEWKVTSTSGNWFLLDTARGFDLSTSDKVLALNTVAFGEQAVSYGNPTATGFSVLGQSASQTYIYMAIRKGLMRPPTDATKVFSINARTGTAATETVTSATIKTAPDLMIGKTRSAGSQDSWLFSRLQGEDVGIRPNSTAAQGSAILTKWNQDGFELSVGSTLNASATTYIHYMLKQARGVLDIVAYTGTGSAHTEAHNLGVVPELIIVKCRSAINDWAVYYGDPTDYLLLNSTAATADDDTYWNDTAPTASVFSVKTNADVNTSTATYIAFLFATLAGISKVGTYTGTATTKQVDCGFSAGARFVLIKRIDSTGDWYFWDTTRGIISGNDPYLLLNSQSAEVTSQDYIDPYSPGFELSSSAPAAINASGGTYLFLAIA